MQVLSVDEVNEVSGGGILGAIADAIAIFQAAVSVAQTAPQYVSSPSGYTPYNAMGDFF